MPVSEFASYWEWFRFEAEQVGGRVHYRMVMKAQGMTVPMTMALGSHDVGAVMTPKLESFLKKTVFDHVEEVIHHSVEPF
jgi:hypothetical protein